MKLSFAHFKTNTICTAPCQFVCLFAFCFDELILGYFYRIESSRVVESISIYKISLPKMHFVLQTLNHGPIVPRKPQKGKSPLLLFGTSQRSGCSWLSRFRLMFVFGCADHR